MDFEYSPKVKALQNRVSRFHAEPRLSERRGVSSSKSPRATAGNPRDRGAEEEGERRGLWNLFLPEASSAPA